MEKSGMTSKFLTWEIGWILVPLTWYGNKEEEKKRRWKRKLKRKVFYFKVIWLLTGLSDLSIFDNSNDVKKSSDFYELE